MSRADTQQEWVSSGKLHNDAYEFIKTFDIGNDSGIAEFIAWVRLRHDAAKGAISKAIKRIEKEARDDPSSISTSSDTLTAEVAPLEKDVGNFKPYLADIVAPAYNFCRHSKDLTITPLDHGSPTGGDILITHVSWKQKQKWFAAHKGGMLPFVADGTILDSNGIVIRSLELQPIPGFVVREAQVYNFRHDLPHFWLARKDSEHTPDTQYWLIPSKFLPIPVIKADNKPCFTPREHAVPPMARITGLNHGPIELRPADSTSQQQNRIIQKFRGESMEPEKAGEAVEGPLQCYLLCPIEPANYCIGNLDQVLTFVQHMFHHHQQSPEDSLVSIPNGQSSRKNKLFSVSTYIKTSRKFLQAEVDYGGESLASTCGRMC